MGMSIEVSESHLSVSILGTLAQIKSIANVPQNYLKYINMGIIAS
jgi:hypothetical protein